jgi:hypothetical protein
MFFLKMGVIASWKIPAFETMASASTTASPSGNKRSVLAIPASSSTRTAKSVLTSTSACTTMAAVRVFARIQKEASFVVARMDMMWARTVSPVTRL